VSIITISRGSFSGGKTLAECLAQKLEYRCIDRDVIVERAAAHGVSHEELRAALDKPPGFLDRFSHKKYLYLTLIQAALTEEVKDGRAVYHGNAGHLLLRGGGPVFRVRIIAPMEFRIQMCIDRLKFTRAEAINYIQTMDNDRRRWTQYLYGVDWGNPSLYDVVLNLENIPIDDACETVSGMVRRQSCFEYGPECRQSMEDLALASRVKAAVALNSATAHIEVDVRAEHGHVRFKGRIPNVEVVEEVRRVATRVPGVADVSLDDVTSATPV